MVVRTSVVVATLAMCVSVVHAAVIVPVKAYAKPDEPLGVKFEVEKNDEAKTALEKIGWAATKMEDWFVPAASSDVVDDKGNNTFTLYTFTGQKVDPSAKLKPDENGAVDLAKAYPQIKDGGTFILTWKDATPLVVETLFNPGRGKRELNDQLARINGISDPAQRKAELSQFEPTVTHLVPLEYAVIETDKGVIKAKFSYDYAPHTVDNFVSLSKQKFYDGTTFHRIISGFMIQGGDSTGNIDERTGTGGPGYQIMEEFSEKKHERGTLSMARAADPNSAGSQFFIMHQASPNLDGGYSAFGDVFDGMEVVDAIVKTPVSDENGTVKGPKPTINAIKILPATAAIYGIK